MIRKLLIANRGEIACRIIRTCRDMGIATVAVYSDADARALHVDMADEAVHVGASPAAESYLDGAKLIDAARRTNADAVHPGFGFLAENAAFAQAVIDAGFVWIGAPPTAIEEMGDKRRAKRLLKGIPLVPGYEGDDQTDAALLAAARDLGFPIMIKAAAGGGGKGMRRVDSAADLPDALAGARREAKAAFGDDTLILERFVANPRHVEIQIFGDTHGTIIALGERECSIQRRHQKIVEETPSTALDEDLRARMCEAAVNIGRRLCYVGAGTVEFLLDADGNFYFMEMNTRLQVEHPVTEMVTGIDLVRWQIEVAEGAALPTSFSRQGHAIEVRVYAEDPANDFLPVSGKILRWRAPEGDGIRVDGGVQSGDSVTIHYDPLLAKISAWGETRAQAIRRLSYALARTQLLGIKSNVALLRRIIDHPDFAAGNTDTSFIERHPDLLAGTPTPPPVALIAAAIARTGLSAQHWRNNPYRPLQQQFQYGDESHTISLTPEKDGGYVAQIGEASHDVRVWSYSGGDMALSVDGHRQRLTVLSDDGLIWWVHSDGGTWQLDWISPLPSGGRQTEESAGSLRAPMPGQVISVNIENGQYVMKGDILLVIEAMKMEHRITAPYTGRVAALYFTVGQSVHQGVKLLELQASDSE